MLAVNRARQAGPRGQAQLITLPSRPQRREQVGAAGCPLEPLTVHHVFPLHLSKNALAISLPISETEDAGSSPHGGVWPGNASPAHLEWVCHCDGLGHLDPNIYYLDACCTGVDQAAVGGRRGPQQRPRWHTLCSNRLSPRPTLARAAPCPHPPPHNFSSQREARAQDWRIKFDLKEFYCSAQ